jgi:ParB family chromosome partitioning protein
MAKQPPKLSGLVAKGALVPSTPIHELPDMPLASVEVESDVSVEAESPFVTKEPGGINEELHIQAPQDVRDLPSDSTAIELNDEKSLPAVPATTAAIAGRNLQFIGIDFIDPNPLAPRAVYTAKMILDRAEDLRSQGQHDPIHVIPNLDAPGRFIICDGWTRVQACRQHKVMDALLAEVHDELSLKESGWFGYEQNESRSMHCDLDRAMFYEALIKAGESAAEISRRTKLSKTLISFYRSYAKLPEDVMEIVLQYPEKFGATAAYQLQKVNEKCGQRKAVALATKYASEELTVRWITNQAQALLEPQKSTSVTPSKQIRYANGGYYKQLGDKFEVSIVVPADKREQFAKEIEKLLDTVSESVTPKP